MALTHCNRFMWKDVGSKGPVGGGHCEERPGPAPTPVPDSSRRDPPLAKVEPTSKVSDASVKAFVRICKKHCSGCEREE